MVNYPAKKDVRVPRNRWFRRFSGDPPPIRRGHISLKMVKCKNFAFCRKNWGKRSKIDEIFPNDFDKKVKGSS